MSLERHDGYAALLEVIDKRARLFGPDQTALHGFYFLDGTDGVHKVQLDTGQLVPNPVLAMPVADNTRVVCLWMQGGHDVAIMPVAS
jgi:hypothetical protein